MYFNMRIMRRYTVLYGLLSIAAGATLLFVIVDACNNTIQRHHPLVQYWAEPRGFVATLLFIGLVGSAIRVGWPEYSDRYEVRDLIDTLFELFEANEVGPKPIMFHKVQHLLVMVRRRESGVYEVKVDTELGTQCELWIDRYRVEKRQVSEGLLPMSDLPYFRALVDFFNGRPAALVDHASSVDIRRLDAEMSRLTKTHP